MDIQEIRAKYPQYSDLSDGDLARGLHRKHYQDIPYADFLKRINFATPVDPTEGMSGTQKALAGAGKAFTDVGRGVRQIFSSDAPTMGGLVTGDKRGGVQQEVDDAKALDAPLMKTGAGLAGNVISSAAMFAPTAFVPVANTLTGAGLAGAAMGAIQPVASGESRLANAGVGGAAGVGGQVLGNALGRALRPVASRLSPEEAALAAAAQREGIPLTAGQKTGSRPLQVAESVMENLPLTSGSQLAGREAQQRAFTAAALKRAGIAGDSAQAPALLAQKNALGAQIGDVAERGTLYFDDPLTTKIVDILHNAQTHLPPDKVKQVAGTVDQIMSQVEQSGAMRGTNYQGWREPLRALASEGGATGRVYGDLRKALDTAFRGQLSGADKEAVEGASRQYANVKTIIDAMGGPGTAPAKGQLSPAQLSAALGRSMGREGKALWRGDLNELARVGQVFVKDQIPNSGTAQRQFVQQLLTGGAGAVPGAGAGYLAGGPEGAAAGAALGMSVGLGGPKLVQALMNSKAGQHYLTEGAVPLTDAGRKALAAALRSAAVGTAVASE